MRKRYEALVILDVSIGEEGINKLIEKIESMINSTEEGELIKTDRWGKKRLAYMINKKQFGFYVLFEFFCNPDFPKEFERMCRFDPEVVRNMVVAIPDVVIKLKDREEALKESENVRRNSNSEEKEASAEVKEKQEVVEASGEDKQSDTPEATKA